MVERTQYLESLYEVDPLILSWSELYLLHNVYVEALTPNVIASGDRGIKVHVCEISDK